MKVSILGSGDISRIWRYAKLTEKEVSKIIEELGKFLAENKFELVIIPDRGIPYLVAKAYKKYNGKKVVGIVPRKDKKFGIKHLEPYLHVVDEEIEVNDWYDANGEIAASGDIVICVGFGPGVLLDICMLYYHYKYFKLKTRLLVLKPSISARIPKEAEERLPYLEYVNSLDALKKKILSYKK